MHGHIRSIALVGFGAFGRLAARHLAPHATLLVHDPTAREHDIRDAGGEPVSLEQAAGADVVLLATPVQAIESAAKAIAPHVRPGSLVADVASVKSLPVRWMLEHLPEHADVLGAHPLFGPQTAAERAGIAGEPIALCRGRIDDESYARVRAFLAEKLSLHVVELTPDEHDRQMALVQAVTHLIGHTASEMDLPDLETGTLAYRRLMQMKHNTENDSPALYDAIQRLNPHAAQARADFLAALIRAKDRADGLA